MIAYIKKKFQHQFHHPNFLYLMVSLFLLILLPPIAIIFQKGVILLNITYGLVILLSAIYTTSNFKELILLLVLGTFLFLLFLLSHDAPLARYLNTALTLLFFSIIFGKLVRCIFFATKIGLNEVFASVTGYLILGVIATSFFFLIEQSIPGSFNLPENTTYYDFLYFSYITLTSVGFGDILPIHPLAKSFTLILGIFGQLYLVILVGIIIGKYLAHENA